MLAITGLGVLLLLFINGAISALNAIGLGKYVGYMQGTFSLLPNQIIIRLPILILLIWRGQYKVKDEPLYNFFLTMMAFDVFASQLASLNENSGRIATYFSEYNMLSIPYAYKAIKNKKTKTLVGGMIITYLIAYWYYNFVISGYSATVPYQFSIG